jgi:hypothetical protein
LEESFRTQEKAERELADWNKKQAEYKIDAKICEILFGYVWIQHYGKNRLVSPGYDKDHNWHHKGKNQEYKDEFSYYEPGILNFHELNNFPRLLAKLIEKGVDVAFTSDELESGYTFYDGIQAIVVSTFTKDFLESWERGQPQLIKGLRKAAYDYCVFMFPNK